MSLEEKIAWAKGFLTARIGSARPEVEDDKPAYERLLEVIEELEKRG